MFRLMRSTVFIAIMKWLAPKIWRRLTKHQAKTTNKPERKYVKNKAE